MVRNQKVNIASTGIINDIRPRVQRNPDLSNRPLILPNLQAHIIPFFREPYGSNGLHCLDDIKDFSFHNIVLQLLLPRGTKKAEFIYPWCLYDFVAIFLVQLLIKK
jgi:hypothetical protein